LDTVVSGRAIGGLLLVFGQGIASQAAQSRANGRSRQRTAGLITDYSARYRAQSGTSGGIGSRFAIAQRAATETIGVSIGIIGATGQQQDAEQGGKGFGCRLHFSILFRTTGR
jgi:hypothetical protein